MTGKHRASTLLLVVALFCRIRPGFAQEIQNGLSYRDTRSEGYFRFNYENDLFFGTDRYFTQGVHFELQNRGISRSFVHKLFSGLRNASRQYCGVGLESAGYSPSSIVADSILYGDHPFAGLAYGKLFAVSIDTVHQRRLTGTLSLGWMGPLAGGYEIQSAIHKAVGSPEPLGWKYQLKDQPVINYELDYEQQFNHTPRWLRISGCAMLRAGTLSNRAALGGIVNIVLPERGLVRLNVYAHPALSFSVYESVLQGGPLTHDNPYRIAAAGLQRIVGSVISGANLRVGSVHLSGYARWQTRTFKSGAGHALGGLTVAVAF